MWKDVSPAAAAGCAWLVIVALPQLAALADSADWPTYRYNASRTAATEHQLADELHLQWTLELPAPRRAWPRQMDDFDKLAFDASYQPVVAGDLLYVPSMVTDSVTAYAIDSGRPRWRYVTDGPVRMAPTVWQGRLYAASDDGCVYCLDAASGELVWKFQAAPTNRTVLGNRRLISMWPVRGGPVISDDTLYFAAGIWPHEGIFLYALDATSGDVLWVNSGSSSDMIQDAKSYLSFGGVAPQGHLAVAGRRLIVPGGRTVPGVYDRQTGSLLYFYPSGSATGKAAGGHNVFVQGDWFFNERDQDVTHMYHVASGAQYGNVHVDVAGDQALIGIRPERDRVYGYAAQLEPSGDEPPELPIATAGPGLSMPDEPLDAVNRSSTLPRQLRSGAIAEHFEMDQLWTTEVEGIRRMHLKAGSTLYGSGEAGAIHALQIDDISAAPRLKWTKSVPGEVFTMLAAHDRLFVVTEAGQIHCFGPQQPADEPPARAASDQQPQTQPPSEDGQSDRDDQDGWSKRAEQALARVDARGGYGLIVGVGSGRLLEELLRQSDLHVVAFDPDAEKVARLRDRFLDAGLYGTRVAVHQGTPGSLRLPPYIASLVASEDLEAAGLGQAEALVDAWFQPLRPYGGIAYAPVGGESQERFAMAVAEADLEQAELVRADDHLLLVRPGPLPGSDSWTHQYGDASNTGWSADQRVKAPLGIAWYGSEPNNKTLPRHMHGPIPQVVDGRLILLGPHHISARCVYTGVELWSVELSEVGAFFTDFDFEARSAPVYFPNHPGANFIGSPYASAPDNVYLIHHQQCLVLDTATGQQQAVFELPEWDELRQHARDPVTDELLKSYGAQVQQAEPLRWGHIRFWQDYLIAAAYPHMYDDGQPGREKNWNATSSEFLVVMNRHTGDILWVRQARYGFRHNAIVAGGDMLFTIDNLSEEILQKIQRRGIQPQTTPRILAFDIHSGERRWTYDEDVFGTALAYSAAHDALVQSGHPGRRRALPDEPRDRISVLRGNDGQRLWAESYRQRRSPLGLHDSRQKIVGSTGEGAVDMLTGQRRLGRHPLTKAEEQWNWLGALRCGTQNFSEHLILFRSGAAAFTDLAGGNMTGNISGVRAGCTNNLIVADGMLNVPDYTRSCSCSYQLQTSLALTHMPDVEMWTFGPHSDPKPGTIRRLGINLSAPASRMAVQDDLLWVEYPPRVGPRPNIPVKVQTAEDAVWFRQHSSMIQTPDGTHPWVAASGVEGIQAVKLTGLFQDEDSGGATYTVRLHFAEPDAIDAGQRVFDIALQDRTVRKRFDIAAEAGEPGRAVVVEFTQVNLVDDGELEVRFRASGGNRPPLLSGLEVFAER